MTTFYLGQDKLTPELCIKIIQHKIKLKLSDQSKEKITQSAQKVDQIIQSNQMVYGINTGFGPLCSVIITSQQTKQLQENILKSHAVGVGQPIAKQLVKLMLLTKVHALAKGYSGIQLATLNRILFFFDNDILPIVPAQGSVGASGDLAPLAHLFLPLIGYGTVNHKNKEYTAKEIHQKFQITPIQLAAKEGLALINGTQFILAHAVMALKEFQSVLQHADLLAAIQIDAMKGSVAPFKQALHDLRPYNNNKLVANNIRNYLSGSQIISSHIQCNRVQDPYSLRCVPQVHGASRNAHQHLYDLTCIELNSVTDNPVILEDGSTISGGNFHGQPLALPLDYATLAAAEIGNIADRRIYLSLEGDKVGLPKLLLKETGLNSGFMILQYTTAALVSENKSLCYPASADSIPTSLGQEDHVSMGSISARKCLQVITNVQSIQAIELITSLQALELNRPLKSSATIEKVRNAVRKKIPFYQTDDLFYQSIQQATQIITNQELKEFLLD